MRRTKAGELTERDRFWRGHLERIAQEGVAARPYAMREGLSHHALYQAKKRLVGLGAWPRDEKRTTRPRFERVTLVAAPASSPSASPWALRMRLPSGVVFEWATAPEAARVAELVARVGTER